MRIFTTMLVLLALLAFAGCSMKITKVHTPGVAKNTPPGNASVAAKETPPGHAYGLKKNKHIVSEKPTR